MKKSAELREQKALVIDQLNKLVDAAEKEERTLNEAEQSKYEELTKNVETFNERIKLTEAKEARELEMAQDKAIAITGREARQLKKYSLTKAIREGLHGKLTGLEAEMSQEAEKEARDASVSLMGNFAIPSFLYTPESRTAQPQDVATDTYGQETVQTIKPRLIEGLYPKLVFDSMGAQHLNNLSGNVTFPRETNQLTATWEGENDAAAETQSTFDEVALTPIRLAAFTDISKQLIHQSSIGIENFIKNRLSRAVSTALETAIIEGTGSGQPTGILNYSGVNNVSFGATGGAPTWALLTQMETEVATDNALMGNLGWLLNAKTRGKLRTIAKDSGSGLFLWEEANTLLGYKTAVSNLVPSDLTKTTSNLSAMIFADWSKLLIGNWGGMDITVDTYTKAKQALVEVVVNSFWDIDLEHPESFCITDEIITT